MNKTTTNTCHRCRGKGYWNVRDKNSTIRTIVCCGCRRGKDLKKILEGMTRLKDANKKHIIPL